MSLTLGTFMAFPATPTDVTVDGRTVIDPGNASIVRITAINDAANSYLVGISGGVEGRVVFVINATASTLKVSHDYDAEATVATVTDRLRMESGAYTILADGVKMCLYVANVWRLVAA